MPRTITLLIFLAFAFVALILSFKQINYKSQAIKAVENSLKSYSWQMFNSTSWVIAPKEEKQTSLRAQAIYYKENDDIAEFTRPEILQLTPTKTTHIKSLYALSTSTTEVMFAGNVKMQTLTPNDPSTNKTLTTEQITYNNKTQFVTSPVKVTLQASNTTISGIGFNANLTDGQYRFNDKVTTFYQPTKD